MGSSLISYLDNSGEDLWPYGSEDIDVNYKSSYLLNKGPINTFYSIILVILVGSRYF